MNDPELWLGPIQDTVAPMTVGESVDIYAGSVWSVQRDLVLFAQQPVYRDVLIHPGAVAVIAMREDESILLIRQYRHPVASMLLEPPAGLLDDGGADPLSTAKRELAEEAGYTAQTWTTLVDFFNSPGGSSEAIRVYLARGIESMEHGRIQTGEAEEAHLPQVWVPFEKALNAVLIGAIQSPSATIGILAVAAYKQRGWSGLRPADAPWPTRDGLVAHGRVHNLRKTTR